MATEAEQFSLQPTAPVKAVDLGPEFARLEQLTNDLNRAKHPSIAVPPGVKVASEGEYSAPSGADGATTTLDDPIFGSPIPKSSGAVVQRAEQQQPPTPPPQPVQQQQPAAAVVSNSNLSRIFFTGRSGVGKSHLAGLLGAAEFCIQDPILRMLSDEFSSLNGNYPADFINLVIMWGEGYISDKVPITATRLLFNQLARQRFGAEFGRPGFWTGQLLQAAVACDQQSVVTTVTDEKQFTALKDAGFTHFHIMCSNPTLTQRKRRTGANDGLALSLDNQVMKAISMQRDGQKLKVVWCDTAAPTLSGRIYDIGGFLAEARGAQPVGSSIAGE